MIDMGDLREGIMPAELDPFMRSARRLRHVEVAGVGTNLTCYGAVVPTRENLAELVALARRAEAILGRSLLVSGGNSSSLDLAFDEGMPEGITGLRVGESILLGVSTITRRPLPELVQDAFVLEAPVVECRIKPTVPRGRIAQDAFGLTPEFVDRGDRLCAICALGRQDCLPEGLHPLQAGAQVLGASSDHLIVDVQDLSPSPAVGESLHFLPSYGCLLAASTSPYVEKRVHGHQPHDRD
jgi:predicted amino acid racemase